MSPPGRKMVTGKAIIVTVALVFGCVLVIPPVFSQVSIVGDTRSINGMQMYYEEAGEGSPLLLLHQFSGCAKSWHPHVEQLAQHYRLIIPDLRGHGRSTNPSGQFTHRQSALDIFALLDELGLERVKAMGMSSGAMTLIHMATQQPERIEAMVLIGAASYFPDQARAIMRQAVPDSMAATELEGVGACSSRGDTQTRELIGQFHRMKDNYDDMNFTAPYLSTITARTLIVHGDRDKFFPVSIPVQMYAAIPDSYLWIIPNGGHSPIVDDEVEAFRDRALAFLSGQWAQHGH
jgi:pimeloyl-ACP methyl ester carboxylesterase